MSYNKSNYSTFNTIDENPESNSFSYTMMEVKNLQHRRNLIQQNPIVCVYVSASWCEPCKIVGPQVNNLAEMYRGSCLIVKEDYDLQLTRDCQINAIPSFIFYKNRVLLHDDTGAPVVVIGGNLKEVTNILDKLTGRS